MNAADRRSRRNVTLQIVVLVVLMAVLVAAVATDWANARRVLRAADWRLLAPAAIVTALSYLCSSAAYAQACRAFGVAAQKTRLLFAGFVTMAVNNLITLGGAGYAVGAVLLRDRESSLRDIAAASAFNSYLYFAVGTTCLPLSLLYVVGRRLPQRAEVGIVLVVALACLLAVLVNLAVFLPRFRSALLQFLGCAFGRLTRRDVGSRLAAFDGSFTLGLTLLRDRPGRLFGLLAAIIGDWLFCVAAIWFCFAALGIRLHAGVMLSGFFIGIAAGALSMLPGGMGVQDGSMAGVYALLGVPFGPALLAAVLFRVTYYLIPFALGLAVYGKLLRTTEHPSGPPPGRNT
ncbi:MAG: flippase-like domain-containing protein [candidate division WOR-3 bacterium]|nr:flippase-like domain-containing protein [candidate division WOR-3 bacterium]